jgi:hypothetical protein
MAKYKANWGAVDCDSTNTCGITNQKSKGENATRAAQSTY